MLALVLLLLPRAAPAPDVSPGAVDAAIERGVRWLIERQDLDGGWEYQNARRTGSTALVLYTLVKAGVHPSHGSVQRALAHLEGAEAEATYDAALVVLALAAHQVACGDERHQERLAELTERLLDWQHGDWGYPEGEGDLSNTQFAALGLWAAHGAGVAIPAKAWHALATATVAYAVDGGFAYRPGAKPTGSMTAAGVGVLAICRAVLADQRGARRALAELDEGIEGGLAWLARRYTVTENPGSARDNVGYYLYGLERVGALVPSERIGEHDWYQDCAEHLLREQASEGHWGSFRGSVETCFALLLLRRATHPVTGSAARGARSYVQGETPSGLRLAASGDDPLTVWVASFAPGLLDALEWPGERGQGPHVERVLWFADGVEVARLEGDREHPAGQERYPHQQRFAEPGEHVLVAEVHFAAPPARTQSGTELPPVLKVVRSEPLVVQVENVAPEWMLENARDVERALPGVGAARAKPSSELGGHGAALAIDGRQGTSWLAEPGDERPTLVLEFSPAIEADTVLLGHAREWPFEPGRFARAVEVAVAVNGDEPQRVRMHTDERKKGVLELARPTRIRRLELELALLVPGSSGERSAGLAEVELQRREAHR